MEFWGVEVKPGQAVKVDQMELGGLIHISQVALGEASKKDKSNEPAVVYLKVGEQKLVLGTLIRDDIPHLSLDIVLDKEFELSHTSKNASIYFVGYSAEDDSDDAPCDDFTESDEDVALTAQDNEKPEAKAEKPKVAETKKAAAGTSAKQVKIADAKKVEEDDDSDDDDVDDESDDEDESGSPDEMDADSDEDDESDEDEDEETPVKKVDQGKKRPNESASKTPVSAKKAKNVTPEKKTDGKKNAHTATPHPMKKGAKTPNSAAKGQSPGSGGHLSCKSCSKTFNNETGLQQHTKAKHGQ